MCYNVGVVTGYARVGGIIGNATGSSLCRENANLCDVVATGKQDVNYSYVGRDSWFMAM